MARNKYLQEKDTCFELSDICMTLKGTPLRNDSILFVFSIRFKGM